MVLNSVFHDILKLVPWAAFDRLVDEYGTDEAARRFTTRNQFLVLLFAQFGGASSLREVEAVMASHQARLYHVGAKAPKRSTFADANRNRDPRVFSKLFEHMLAASPRGFRRKMGDAVRLIDSTSLRLAGAGAQWARFSSDVFGAKAHVIYDPDLGRPVYHAVTAANVNDITAAKPMPIDPGATYVFDLGYYDFSWWAQLDGAGCLSPHNHLLVGFLGRLPGYPVLFFQPIQSYPRYAARVRFLFGSRKMWHWAEIISSCARLGGAGDRLADIADESVDQGLVVRFAHHPDHRLGAGRADEEPAV